jgi:hypothetical protein
MRGCQRAEPPAGSPKANVSSRIRERVLLGVASDSRLSLGSAAAIRGGPGPAR